MKRIPRLLDHDGTGVLSRWNDECLWVKDGQGVATRKLDGYCCMMRGGVLYKRYTLRKGGRKPGGFEAADRPDPATGATPGWVPVGQGPEDRWFREGMFRFLRDYRSLLDGTYELCGPKIRENNEGYSVHTLVRHGAIILDPQPPRYAEGIRNYLKDNRGIEGIVWHHDDGRMAKIKVRDIGFARNPISVTAD